MNTLIKAIVRIFNPPQISVCNRCFQAGESMGWLQTPSGWFCPLCAERISDDLRSMCTWVGTPEDQLRERQRLVTIQLNREQNARFWAQYRAEWNDANLPPPCSLPPHHGSVEDRQ